MIHLLDSITDAREEHAGGVVVTGSHGGLYPAAVASRWRFRAAIFNDAGVGRGEAGVAGVIALGKIGTPAVAVDCHSARIGEAAETLAGVVTMVNPAAMALRVSFGMDAGEAARRFLAAAEPEGRLDPPLEARREAPVGDGRVWLLDSASLVGPEDEDEVVVTGSHGGLIGGDPARALKARARFAVFNDAGMGKDRIGMSRLPALDARGVAAVTVAAASARIGEAASALESGVISAVNEAAAAMGAEVGMPLRRCIADRVLR